MWMWGSRMRNVTPSWWCSAGGGAQPREVGGYGAAGRPALGGEVAGHAVQLGVGAGRQVVHGVEARALEHELEDGVAPRVLVQVCRPERADGGGHERGVVGAQRVGGELEARGDERVGGA